MGFSPFWEDDEEEAIRIAQEQAVGIAAGQKYIAEQAAKLEQQYQEKYNAAQSEFDSARSELDARQSTMDTYFAGKESTLNQFSDQLFAKSANTDALIQTFNSSREEISVLKNNSGSSSQQSAYYQANAPLKEKGPSPIFYVGAALAAYFLFFKKGF